MSYVSVTVLRQTPYYLESPTVLSLLCTNSIVFFGFCAISAITIQGFKMDQVINLKRAPVTADDVKREILSTCLCSAGAGTSCADCHPTCDLCTKAYATLVAINKSGRWSLLCVWSESNWVVSFCKIPEATLSDPAGGSCSCLNGFVYKNYATTACVPCVPSCPYCVDTSPEGCVNSKDLTIFASNLASSYSLPLLDEASGFICYRQPVPTTTCDPLSVAVTGEIASYGSGLRPIKS